MGSPYGAGRVKRGWNPSKGKEGDEAEKISRTELLNVNLMSHPSGPRTEEGVARGQEPLMGSGAVETTQAHLPRSFICHSSGMTDQPGGEASRPMGLGPDPQPVTSTCYFVVGSRAATGG